MSHRALLRRRAFTLIEILLALGVLAMVVALVGPALFEQIAPRSFDYTMGRLEGELRLAREDARRTGEITLVYATPDDESGRVRIETRLRPPDDEFGNEFGNGFGADFSGGTESPAGWADPRGGGAGSVFAQANASAVGGIVRDPDDGIRLLFELPEGYRITSEPPATLTPDNGFGDSLTRDALGEIGGLVSDSGDGRGPIGGADDPFRNPYDSAGIGGIESGGPPGLLAVCVPDGTVLAATPAWLVDAEDRVARLIIDPASGVIRCERVIAPRDDWMNEEADGMGEAADNRDRRDRTPSDRQRPSLGAGPATGGPP